MINIENTFFKKSKMVAWWPNLTNNKKVSYSDYDIDFDRFDYLLFVC